MAAGVRSAFSKSLRDIRSNSAIRSGGNSSSRSYRPLRDRRLGSDYPVLGQRNMNGRIGNLILLLIHRTGRTATHLPSGGMRFLRRKPLGRSEDRRGCGEKNAGRATAPPNEPLQRDHPAPLLADRISRMATKAADAAERIAAVLRRSELRVINDNYLALAL